MLSCLEGISRYNCSDEGRRSQSVWTPQERDDATASMAVFVDDDGGKETKKAIMGANSNGR